MHAAIAWRDRFGELTPKQVSLGAAFMLALLTGWTTGLIGPGSEPTVSAPYPFPWIWLTIFGWAAPVLPAVLFRLVCGPLFDGKPTGRKRTRFIAALIGFLSFAWFFFSWDFGLRYQGFRFTLMTATGSMFFGGAIATILVSSRRMGRWAWSLLANFLIFAWVVTYAFPYLGELP